MEEQPIKIDAVKDGILPVRCGIQEALRARNGDFCFFSAAALFTLGGFDRDPVVEFGSYYSEVSKQLPFFVELSPRGGSFFSGLGVQPAPRAKTKDVVNWDKRLYIVPKESSEDCFSFIGGIAWLEPKTGFSYYCFPQEIFVPDPSAAFGTVIPVCAFGVVGPNFVVFFDNSTPVPSVRKFYTNNCVSLLQSVMTPEAFEKITNTTETQRFGGRND